MKNVLWYTGYFLLLFVETIIVILAIANIALPIVLMMWLRNAWWLCLWSAEPILIFSYAALDCVTEDL